MIPPMTLAAPAAIHINHDLVIAELQPRDLNVVTGIYCGAVCSHGAVEELGIKLLADGNVEAFFASGEGFDGFCKFPRNKAKESELGTFLERDVFRSTRRFRLRLAVVGRASHVREK